MFQGPSRKKQTGQKESHRSRNLRHVTLLIEIRLVKMRCPGCRHVIWYTPQRFRKVDGRRHFIPWCPRCPEIVMSIVRPVVLRRPSRETQPRWVTRFDNHETTGFDNSS